MLLKTGVTHDLIYTFGASTWQTPAEKRKEEQEKARQAAIAKRQEDEQRRKAGDVRRYSTRWMNETKTEMTTFDTW